MKKLFVIAETLKSPGGTVVIAGTDTRLNTMNAEKIRDVVGRQLRVGGKNYPVKGVEVATALSGGKNIFINIAAPPDTNFDNGKVAYVN